tara:strand:- start:173 stop:1282 length:1110 start_codon:yes stop_codon:yes gene_type:complete
MAYGTLNAGTITPGSGNTLTVSETVAFTGTVSHSDGNITNVGDIALDTISSDAGTSIGVTLGTDAGDDFNVGSGKLVVEGDSGNVGIGVVPEAWQSSRTALQIGDSTAVWGDSYKNTWFTNNVYRNAVGTDSRINASYASQIYMNNGGSIFLQTAVTAAADSAISWISPITILSNGNVLYGTTNASPGEGSTSGTRIGLSGKSQFSAGSAVVFMVNRFGTDGTLQEFKKSGTTVGSITVTGSATAFNTSSDYRLKENVVAMSGSIDRLKALKPSRFNFIVDADTTVDGFLAHEAQAVVPEAITGTKDAMQEEEYEVTPAVMDGETVVTEAVMGTRSVPDMQGIDQSKLVPLLVSALQEAITRIETLENA